jgi:hypothetical protein
MDKRDRKLEWLGKILGGIVISTILYFVVGPVGIFYGVLFFIFVSFPSNYRKSLSPDVGLKIAE